MQEKTADADAPKNVVDLTGLSNDDCVSVLFRLLQDTDHVFVRAGRLVRVTEEGVENLDVYSLLVALGRYHFIRGDSKQISDRLLQVTLHDPRCKDALQQLDAVSRVPVLKPDGQVQYTEGYEWRTKQYHIPDANLDVHFDQRCPNKTEAWEALQQLLRLVEDTPFEDKERGPAAWVAYVLAVFSRHLYARSPLFLFDGNEPGGGKTILMTMGAAIHSGAWGPVNNLPNNEEEFDKRVPTYFDAAEPYVLFDEVRSLTGAGLKTVLTSDYVQGRTLGKSLKYRVRNNKVLAATGNNVSLEGDMRRRTIRIGVMKPPGHVRYKIGNIEKYVLDHRDELFQAAMTILRWGMTTKDPRPDIDKYPSYEEFSRYVREPLFMLGLPDPYAAQDDSMATDADDVKEAFADFATALEALGNDFRAADISEHLNDETGPLWAYRGLFWSKSSAPLDSRVVGRVMRQHLNKYLPNGKVIRRRTKDGYSVYVISAV